MIKMYIPIDSQHINIAAKKIFEYMESQGMEHQSKIGSKLRFDDIVIRVDSIENARKIENFIMSDPYIMEGMMKPNPFAYNNSYISYAWDGNLSYNETVACYISDYINNMKRKNSLDKVSYQGFYDYIRNMYNSVFINGTNIERYNNIMSQKRKPKYYFQDYEKVTRLILLAINPNKTRQNFFDIYNNIVSGNNTNSIIEDQRLHNVIINENISDYINKHQHRWDEIYDFLGSKYGCQEDDQRIFLFIKSGDYRLFTRENNVRQYVLNNNITREMVQKLYLSMRGKKMKREILASAVKDTYNKYGYYQIKIALENAKRGIFYNFTNDNNGRNIMQRTINPSEINGLIIGYFMEKGYGINDIPNNINQLYDEYIYLIQNDKKNNYKR